jgi:hypothetical protein
MTGVRAAIATALLAGPTVLAFFSGAYFDRPRLWAGIVVWAAVAVAAVACPRPWPRTRAGWLAVGGLAGLTAWTAVSISWAPLRDVAQADAQRLLLYLGVLVAGIAVFRSRAVASIVEPLLALGAVVVVAEGLSERLLPGLFTLARSEAVPGRLFQPLTYWNAMGVVAAMGIVLCVAVAGDRARPAWMRACAGAATPVLALGGYLTLSRGAVLAAVVGLTLLAALRPTAAQLRALAFLAAAAAPAVLFGAMLDAVRTLEGSSATRERQGLIMLAVLAVSVAGAAAAILREARRGPSGSPTRRARRATRAALALVAVGVVAGFAVLVSQQHDTIVEPLQGATSSRLADADSNRGDFWRVARGAFEKEPVRGLGSGGFRVEWLRERSIIYAARDAHSLYFETAAELGLVGLALLAAFVAGIAAAAIRAHRLEPGPTAGPIAVAGLWAVHAGVDWDWELPAVSLIALVAAAMVVARGDEPPSVSREEPRPEPAIRRPQPAEVTL